MPQPVLIAPLNAVRRAVYARIQADPATSAHALLGEGEAVDFPYLVVGPAYKGAGGTDPEYGIVSVILQVDAFVSTDGGGAFTAEQMLQDVALALSTTDLTVDVRLGDGTTATSQPLVVTIEDDVLNPTLRDAADGETYAQRFVRFRLGVTT